MSSFDGVENVSRRTLVAGIGGVLLCAFGAGGALGSDEVPVLDFMDHPSFDQLGGADQFGYKPPTSEEREAADRILAKAPSDVAPFELAEWFVERYSGSDLISQWPAADSWNPLVVSFFEATATKANNDMIAWCAAFANWCLERTGRTDLMTRSASSQSFLKASLPSTSSPSPGDIAVFTCFDEQGQSMGLGHVAFFKEKLTSKKILVVGGNQSADGHSSIISEKPLPTDGLRMTRHVDGQAIPCSLRLNRYVKVG